MSYRLMFIINAIALALVGVVFLIAPSAVLSQFKSEIYVATLYVARLLGAVMLLSGLLLWFLKDSATKLAKNISFLLLAYSIGGFVMSLLGMTTFGVVRDYGWVLLVIFGLFTLLYAYILFLQPKPAPAKSRSPRGSSKGKSVLPTDGEPYQ
jgi:hypothetical protein